MPRVQLLPSKCTDCKPVSLRKPRGLPKTEDGCEPWHFAKFPNKSEYLGVGSMHKVLASWYVGLLVVFAKEKRKCELVMWVDAVKEGKSIGQITGSEKSTQFLLKMFANMMI